MSGCVRVSLALAVVCLSWELSVSQYINEFAVRINGGREDIEVIAKSLGFTVEREMPSIKVFLLSHPEVNHRSKRSSEGHLETLRSHPKILYAQQEQILVRDKRAILHDKQVEMSIRDIKDNSVYYRVPEDRLAARGGDNENIFHFRDPYFKDQWYLRNGGQTGGTIGLDLNLDPAWSKGFTGKDVVLCVLDDGIDYKHPDLEKNFDINYSKDLNDPNDPTDPMPDKSNPENRHGTRCAGEIVAVANNTHCGIGVAYEAHIGGVRILDGKVTDAMEAEALNFKMNDIHIFSASWGPRDNGSVFDGPYPLAAEALKRGVREGRNGLGSIYVWATGNGGYYDDDCGADGYVSSIETISFGSTTDRGKMPFFMEKCTSTMAVVPTGGAEPGEKNTGQPKINVVTTDISGGCMLNFEGTSSAAPLAAGCIALALQANNKLTWRDVQHLVVHSARIPSVDDSWKVNGAGLPFSHKFGFGLLDCGRLVYLAQKWKRESEQRKCACDTKKADLAIGSYDHVTDWVEVNACAGTQNEVRHLEHVQVSIKLQHSRRGDIQIKLISPSGTMSEILSTRSRDSEKGIDFTFTSVHFWQEDPAGRWELEVQDSPNDDWSENEGTLQEWKLVLYGLGNAPANTIAPTAENKGYAYTPEDVESLMNVGKNRSKVNIVPYEPAALVSKKAVASPAVYAQENQDNDKIVQYLLRALNEPQLKVTETGKKIVTPVKRLFRMLGVDRLDRKINEKRAKTSLNSGQYDDEVRSLADELMKELDERELSTLVDILTREVEASTPKESQRKEWLDVYKDETLDAAVTDDDRREMSNTRHDDDKEMEELADAIIREVQPSSSRNTYESRQTLILKELLKLEKKRSHK